MYQPPIFPCSFNPTNDPLHSNFRKFVTVLLQRNTLLFLSLFSRIKRQPQVWSSPEVEQTVSERRKAFAALIEVMKINKLTSQLSEMSRLSLTRPKLRHRWPHAIHSLLNLTLHLCILSFVAGSSFSSSFSPNFPNCSSPRELASVFADYLRSHFSVSQPKALHSRARGYLSKFHQARCPEESHTSVCSSFYPAEFLATATNLFSSFAIGPDKVAKCKSTFLACIYSSLWNLTPFSLPARPVFNLDGLLLIKFCIFLSPLWMGLTNPNLALGTILSTIDFPKVLSGIPPFSTKFMWFSKFTKVAPLVFVELLHKDPFWIQYLSLFSSMISLLLCLLPSAALFTLTIWSFGPLPPPRSLL